MNRTSPDSRAAGGGRGATRRRWTWLAGVGLLTLLLLLALWGLDWSGLLSALARARPPWLVAAVAANLLILPLGTWQWMWLLPPGRTIRFGRMFWIRSVTSTVANAGPFLSGYAAAVYLVATKGRVGYEASVSLKAVEQAAIALSKMGVVMAAVAVAPLPTSFRAGIIALIIGAPLLTGILFVGAGRAATLERWAATRRGRQSAILEFASRVALGLKTIRHPRAFASGVGLGLAQKGAEALAIAAVAASLGVSLTAGDVVLVLAAVNLSTMVSVTPANLGIYEGSAVLAYRMAGVDTPTAVALSMLQHLTYLVPLAGVGWLLMVGEGRGLRQVTGPAERERAEAGGDEEPGSGTVEREAEEP